MATPNPSKKSVSDIKSVLLKPALTSHFLVYIKPPSDATKFFQDNGASPVSPEDKLILLCSDANLPGSSFTTHESNNDFHGTTERFAYRRIYDDRIDLSFYVDATDYFSIRFFEAWMKYIAYESISGYTQTKRPGTKESNFYYRFKYPDGAGGYRNNSALSIVKFERDYNKKMVYEFIKPYPISIQSMPVSYDSSSLLKCTISMTYIRYILYPPGTSNPNQIPEEFVSGGNQSETGFGDPALEQAVQRALDPLSGSGFSNPVDEARFQRLNNPQFNPGFSESSLNAGYNAVFGTQSEVTIRDFQ
jgi:hypothetical protein